MNLPTRKNRRVYVFVLIPLLLGGCMRAPTVDILGSFFPAWLICFAVAILMTGLCRFLLMRYHMKFDLPVLVYPSLTALFTCLLWLIFFY
jgi:hypothetical protein